MTKLSDYPIRAASVPWVRKEDWAAFIAIMEDRDDAPPSWEDFNQRSEQFEGRLKAQGYLVIRAYIDPETFPEWCAEHGYGVDSKDREAFAVSIANEKHGRNDS